MHARAGQLARPEDLIDLAALTGAYFDLKPDMSSPGQRVAFGTSGHRGSSLDGAFNEAHILAMTQAICERRAREGATGPLFLGMDTHALSESACASALEVLAANRVAVMIDDRDGYTPTPVISHAILTHNHGRTGGLADGIVVTGGSPRGATIATYSDHRIAMSFAILGLAAPGMVIEGEECVGKSFPGFWETLEGLYR